MSAICRRHYASDTHIDSVNPFGLYVGGRVLCSDGVVRTLKRIAQTPDTFFSVPAAVSVNGKTVSGYVTFETEQGYTTASTTDPVVAKFVRYDYGVNADMLPAGTFRKAFDFVGR